MSTEAVTPEVELETPTLQVTKRQQGLLDVWLERGEGNAIERLEKAAEALHKIRLLSIKQTYASDWILHASVDQDGNVLAERAYLQDIGADRAGKVWGVQLGQVLIEREDFADGTYTYNMLSDAWSKVTGEYVTAEGSRWSGDKFFKRSSGPEDKVDPTDVRKSAYANLHGRAVRALAGLGGVPIEMLRQAGLDVDRCVRVGYAKGAKGGESTGATTGATATGSKTGPVINFGSSKGKHVGELSSKDLAWYIKAVGESVEDPAKAQYKDRNEKLLDALKARDEELKHPKPAAGGKPNRGQRQTAVFKRLSSVEGISAAPLMMHLMGKTSLSDCSDEDLAKLEALTDAEIQAAAADVLGTGDGRE